MSSPPPRGLNTMGWNASMSLGNLNRSPSPVRSPVPGSKHEQARASGNFRAFDITSTNHFRNNTHYAQWDNIKAREAKNADPRVEGERKSTKNRTARPGGSVSSKSDAFHNKIKPKTFYRRRHLAGRIFAEEEAQKPKPKPKKKYKQQPCHRCDGLPCICCNRCLSFPCICEICEGCDRYVEICSCCSLCHAYPCDCRCDECKEQLKQCKCCTACSRFPCQCLCDVCQTVKLPGPCKCCAVCLKFPCECVVIRVRTPPPKPKKKKKKKCVKPDCESCPEHCCLRCGAVSHRNVKSDKGLPKRKERKKGPTYSKKTKGKKRKVGKGHAERKRACAYVCTGCIHWLPVKPIDHSQDFPQFKALPYKPTQSTPVLPSAAYDFDTEGVDLSEHFPHEMQLHAVSLTEVGGMSEFQFQPTTKRTGKAGLKKGKRGSSGSISSCSDASGSVQFLGDAVDMVGGQDTGYISDSATKSRSKNSGSSSSNSGSQSHSEAAAVAIAPAEAVARAVQLQLSRSHRWVGLRVRRRLGSQIVWGTVIGWRPMLVRNTDYHHRSNRGMSVSDSGSSVASSASIQVHTIQETTRAHAAALRRTHGYQADDNENHESHCEEVSSQPSESEASVMEVEGPEARWHVVFDRGSAGEIAVHYKKKHMAMLPMHMHMLMSAGQVRAALPKAHTDHRSKGSESAAAAAGGAGFAGAGGGAAAGAGAGAGGAGGAGGGQGTGNENADAIGDTQSSLAAMAQNLANETNKLIDELTLTESEMKARRISDVANTAAETGGGGCMDKDGQEIETKDTDTSTVSEDEDDEEGRTAVIKPTFSLQVKKKATPQPAETEMSHVGGDNSGDFLYNECSVYSDVSGSAQGVDGGDSTLTEDNSIWSSASAYDNEGGSLVDPSYDDEGKQHYMHSWNRRIPPRPMQQLKQQNEDLRHRTVYQQRIHRQQQQYKNMHAGLPVGTSRGYGARPASAPVRRDSRDSDDGANAYRQSSTAHPSKEMANGHRALGLGISGVRELLKARQVGGV